MATTPNKERIARLVEALRSGEFQQGKGYLHNISDDTYCCLGVACVIALRNGVDLEVGQVQIYRGREYIDVAAYGLDRAYLPGEVQEWFGFEHHNPTITFLPSELGSPFGTNAEPANVPASVANDTYNMNFDAIADAFERKYITT